MGMSREKMTHTLALLRHLIQSEVDYAFQVENEYRFSYETREANARKWRELEAILAEHLVVEEEDD